MAAVLALLVFGAIVSGFGPSPSESTPGDAVTNSVGRRNTASPAGSPPTATTLEAQMEDAISACEKDMNDIESLRRVLKLAIQLDRKDLIPAVEQRIKELKSKG